MLLSIALASAHPSNASHAHPDGTGFVLLFWAIAAVLFLGWVARAGRVRVA